MHAPIPTLSHTKRAAIRSLFLYEDDYFLYYYQNALLVTYFQKFLVKLNTYPQQACS